MPRDSQGHTAGNNNSYDLLAVFHVLSTLLRCFTCFLSNSPNTFAIHHSNKDTALKDSTPAVLIARQDCWRALAQWMEKVVTGRTGA